MPEEQTWRKTEIGKKKIHVSWCVCVRVCDVQHHWCHLSNRQHLRNLPEPERRRGGGRRDAVNASHLSLDWNH